MEILIDKRKLSLILGDITEQNTDAIVNAANSGLMGGGGVDGAIHRAGGHEILEECKRIVSKRGRLPAGEAVLTSGGNLPAKYVIHTVGPVWHGGTRHEEMVLSEAYKESLRVAEVNKLNSVSFPSISTGAYGYPVDKAARVAIRTALLFLKDEADSIDEVLFVLYDDRSLQAYQKALEEVENEFG